MDDVKNKMYNYEVTPPEGVWEAIADELDRNGAKVIPLTRKRNNAFYYVAAASVAVLVFCLIFFTNRSSTSSDKLITSSDNKKTGDSTVNNNLMTVPTEEKSTVKNNNGSLAKNKIQKDRPDQKQTKDVIRDNDSALLANNTARYITIEGPQGQPVKISSKMASLIDSSETQVPGKPIWHKKINEWREIMKGNTLAPTPGNFLDIVELTKSLKDNK
jgi:hypothetical protein